MRDDFSRPTKELLAKRVGYRCSNPDCRRPTSGPQDDPLGTINLGVAAHITAASPGGPRYDSSLTTEQRSAPSNGIWVCQNCAKLVDSDDLRYSLVYLQDWKRIAELAAVHALEDHSTIESGLDAALVKAERLMPQLLAEMRSDLADSPLGRELVLLRRSWSYWAKGNELAYYYDEHPELDNMLLVLENLGLVHDITYNNTKRFVITEMLADYLRSGQTG